jgi:Protein of unknown function (DUF433)
MPVKWRDYIEERKDVMMGKPVLKGTRLTVEHILRELGTGIDRHRDDLVRCSLPEFVFSDKLTWFRFLEHGGWHPQPHWTVGMLSPNHAAALNDFIRSEYGPDEYRHLLRNLEDIRPKASSG